MFEDFFCGRRFLLFPHWGGRFLVFREAWSLFTFLQNLAGGWEWNELSWQTPQSEEHVNYFSDTCVTCAYHPIPFLLDSMTWLQFQVNFTIHDNIRSVRTGAEGTACVASRRSLRWMKNLIMIPLFCECGCAENTIESMARCVLKKVIRFRV